MNAKTKGPRPSDVWKRMKKCLTRRDKSGARALLAELRDDQKPTFLWKYVGHCKNEGYEVLTHEVAATANTVATKLFVSAMAARTEKSPKGPLPGYGDGPRYLMFYVVAAHGAALEERSASWPSPLRHGYWFARGQRGEPVPALVVEEVASTLLPHALTDQLLRYDIAQLRTAFGIPAGLTASDRALIAAATGPLRLESIGSLLVEYSKEELLAIKSPLLAHGTSKDLFSWFDSRSRFHPAECTADRVAIVERLHGDVEAPPSHLIRTHHPDPSRGTLEVVGIQLIREMIEQGLEAPPVLFAPFQEPHWSYVGWAPVLALLSNERVAALCDAAEKNVQGQYQASLLPVRARFLGTTPDALFTQFETLFRRCHYLERRHLIRSLADAGQDALVDPLIKLVDRLTASWAHIWRDGPYLAAGSPERSVLAAFRAALGITLGNSTRPITEDLLEYLRPNPIGLFGGPGCKPNRAPDTEATVIFLDSLRFAQPLFLRMSDTQLASWILDWQTSHAASERLIQGCVPVPGSSGAPSTYTPDWGGAG